MAFQRKNCVWSPDKHQTMDFGTRVFLYIAFASTVVAWEPNDMDMRKEFNELDVNHNGKVSLDELIADHVEDMESHPEAMWMSEMVNRLDKDKNGLDFQEFIALNYAIHEAQEEHHEL